VHGFTFADYMNDQCRVVLFVVIVKRYTSSNVTCYSHKITVIKTNALLLVTYTSQNCNVTRLLVCQIYRPTTVRNETLHLLVNAYFD